MAQAGSSLIAFAIASLVIVAMMPNKPTPSPIQAAPENQAAAPPDESAPAASNAPVAVPSPAQSAAASRQMVSNAYGYVSLERAPDSHFYADVEVNGTTVHFLLDTGATEIVLAPADAQRVGITGDNFTVTAMSAGGEIRLMPAIADRIALGPLAASDVPVLVAKDKLSISLLGQSYLSRIGTVSISGDTMILR